MWMCDHLDVEPEIRYKFKFGAEVKRIAVRVPVQEQRKYLVILPLFEEGTDPNMPFEIGFVGATTKKEILLLPHLEHAIKKYPLTEFVEVIQKDKVFHPNSTKIEFKDSSLKVLV